MCDSTHGAYLAASTEDPRKPFVWATSAHPQANDLAQPFQSDVLQGLPARDVASALGFREWLPTQEGWMACEQTAPAIHINAPVPEPHWQAASQSHEATTLNAQIDGGYKPVEQVAQSALSDGPSGNPGLEDDVAALARYNANVATFEQVWYQLFGPEQHDAAQDGTNFTGNQDHWSPTMFSKGVCVVYQRIVNDRVVRVVAENTVECPGQR